LEFGAVKLQFGGGFGKKQGFEVVKKYPLKKVG
jgi:hypothetical protein